MAWIYEKLFEDQTLIDKIQKKLPYLFQLAEIDNSRNSKLGMEIGSARERILIALLMYVYGNKNVNVNIPIIETQIDVLVYDKPLSIKTITGRQLSGVKLVWTVDPQKALEFSQAYKPKCDLLLVQINWNDYGHLFLIPCEIQIQTLESLGRDSYIKLPKQGTNPRGVELSKEALMLLVSNPNTKVLKIKFDKCNLEYNQYARWLTYWEQDD